MTSISAERSGLANVGSGLIRRDEWGSRFNYSGARTVVEPAEQVFIHITVTNPGAYRSHAAHIRAIEAIGISRFPNTGGSYNRVVVAGVTRAYELQPVGRRGAHTVNDHRRSTCNRWGGACPGNGGDLTAPSWNLNYTARSYAYGANTHHSVPDSVIDTFARAIADDIQAGFVRRGAKIHGHRCVSSKSCPGDKLWARMHDLERRVEHHVSNGPNGEDMPSPKEVWRWDELEPPRGLATARNPKWEPKRHLEVAGDLAARREFASPYLRDKIRQGKGALTRWLIEWTWYYSREGRNAAREARDEARNNGKQIATLAAQVSALSSAVEQLSNGAVDMAQIRQEAYDGAAAVLQDAEFRVTFENSDEPEDEPEANA